VSADVDKGNVVRSKKMKKVKRSKPERRTRRMKTSTRKVKEASMTQRPTQTTPAPQATTASAEPLTSPGTTSPAATAPAARTHAHERAWVWRMSALGAIGILLLGALAFARRPSNRVATPVVDVQPQRQEPVSIQPAASPINAAPPATSIPRKASAPKPVKRPSTETAPAKAAATTVADLSTTRLSSREELPSKQPQVISAVNAAPAPARASVSAAAAAQAPVTITGCLEMSVDQDQFRLTDTEGADAPKSRSWKSAFLKKRPAPVTLVEPPEAAPLQTHVGQRVAATGLLSSHELRVRSLKVVASSCD